MQLPVLSNSDDIVSIPAMHYTPAQPPLTNWSPHSIVIWGHHFKSAEHAFQFRKHSQNNSKVAQKILLASCPDEAKKLGWSAPINLDEWERERQNIMFEILSAKYIQHEDVQQALKNTGDKPIIQYTEDEDTFWGIGKNGNGRNTMGKLWMLLRETYTS